MGAFDGNGTFVRTYSWTNDAANGIDITASRVDTEDNGYAAGLTLCVTRDGQGAMAADLLPSTTTTYNIGSAAKQWVAGFFSGAVTVGTKLVFAAIPAFNAQRTGGTLTCAASSTTTIVYDTVNYDNGNHYINTTGIYTAILSGLYQFNATAFLQNNASGAAVLSGVYLSKNNAVSGTAGSAFSLGGYTVGGSINASSNPFSVGASILIPMTAGDTMRVKVDMSTVSGVGNFGYTNLGTFSGTFITATS